MEKFMNQVLAYMLNVVFAIIGIGVLIVIFIMIAGKKLKDKDFKNH